MRIIGKGDNGNLLAEMSVQDIHSLVGISSPYADEAKDKAQKLGCKNNQSADAWIGLAIPINKMFSASRSVMEGFNKSYSFREAQKNIENLANELNLIATIYNLPEEKKK